MKFWFKTAFLFLFRSGRSTAMLSLMVVTAVTILIFLSSLAVGVNDTMIRNSVGLYSGEITGFDLKPGLSADRLRIAGTKAVLKRVPIQGSLSRGNRSETINLVGVEPDEEMKVTALWKKTVAGKYLSDDSESIYLSQRVAEILGVGVGDWVQFTAETGGGPVRLVVSGLFRTGIDILDRDTAFCSSKALDGKGATWRAAVFLQDGIDPEQVIGEYGKSSLLRNHFKSWKAVMPDLVQLIDLNYVSMSVVMILVFGVVSLGISCTFIIFILRNIREYGIMKAMGVSPFEMALLIVFEVFLMSFSACVIGIVMGTLAVMIWGHLGVDLTVFTSENRYFAVSGMVFPRLTEYSLVLPPALALFFGLLASAWPMALVIRKRTAELLRIL